ncbi:MAG: hypothetical protein WA153_07515, partial [Candidatus Acidiferrales bacterium]
MRLEQKAPEKQKRHKPRGHPRKLAASSNLPGDSSYRRRPFFERPFAFAFAFFFGAAFFAFFAFFAFRAFFALPFAADFRPLFARAGFEVAPRAGECSGSASSSSPDSISTTSSSTTTSSCSSPLG